MLQLAWMQSATRLRVYGEAENLAVLVYELTRALPPEERYGLSSQMRRAAVSIGSNIAEGCGRDGNVELSRFLRIALGSATELEFQLRLVGRLSVARRVEVDPPMQACLGLQRMLTRLIVRLRPAPEASRGRPVTETPSTEKPRARLAPYPRYDSSARARDTCRSRDNAFSLICRTRSRVIPSRLPICSSVIGSSPSRPK